jgi:predicted neuraminidase
VFLGPRFGEVWLVVGVNYGRWCSGDTYLFFKRSLDSGKSWTDLELLVETKGLLGRNKAFHGDGVWILPVEWERTWSAAFLRSVDDGNTWKIIGDLGRAAGAHLIQPAVVRLSDGALLAYMRSQEGYIYRSESRDRGETWTVPEPTPFPNNNSGIDMVRLRSGLLALVHNPVGLPGAPPPLDERWPERMPVGFDRWGERSPLVISFSPDDGVSWPWSLTLEDEPGEYSYPAVIQGKDGTVHITYTYQRMAIRHVTIEEAEVERICRGS